MKKTPLVSFQDYQQSLLEKGMAVAAECTHASYGRIIFHQIIKSPPGDLPTTVEKVAVEALSERCQEINQQIKKLCNPRMLDTNYTKLLIREFEEEKSCKSYRFTDREWIDSNNPWSGILAKPAKDIYTYFELRVNPHRLHDVWENELNLDVDEEINDCMRFEIDLVLREWHIGVDSSYSYPFEWDNMASLDDSLYSCCRYEKKSEKLYREIRSTYLDYVLSPVFDNYKNYLLYMASPYTAYLVIGRPHFYAIIAGERIDGSHEITIFDGYNEI